MQRIIIICEGQTEQEFCNKILAPYFINLAYHIQAILPTKSGGGIVKWEHLKKDICNYLKSNNQIFVTTFIDYYKLPPCYPKYDEAHKNNNINQIIDIIEKSILDDVNHYKFIPYIQLHEFENLLFNDINSFKIVEHLFKDKNYLIETLNEYKENSELINNGKNTAPSKRLANIIAGYNKTLHGIKIAQNITLSNMRTKNPRFNAWLTKLENLSSIG